MHIRISASSTPHLASKHRSISMAVHTLSAIISDKTGSFIFFQTLSSSFEARSLGQMRYVCPACCGDGRWCSVTGIAGWRFDLDFGHISSADGSVFTKTERCGFVPGDGIRDVHKLSCFRRNRGTMCFGHWRQVAFHSQRTAISGSPSRFPPSLLSHLIGSFLFSWVSVEAQKVCARRTLRRYTHGVADAGVFRPGTQTFEGGSTHRTEQHAARSYTQLILQYFQGGHSRTRRSDRQVCGR